MRSVRDKGVLSVGLLIIAVAFPPFPGSPAVGMVSVFLLLGPIGVGCSRLARILWVPLVSILIGIATVAVSAGWDGGPRLQVTAPGLTTAAGLAVRAVAATLAMLTLACSTPMVDLLSALRRAGVPDPLVEIAALVYRFTFGLLESVGAIHAAQEARLGYANRSAAMRSASLGVAALFVRSWDHARRLEAGLAGRGYVDSLRTLEPDRVRSAAFLASSLGLLTGLAVTSVAVAVLG
jgi:cobalt/nickel transport system permease protein